MSSPSNISLSFTTSSQNKLPPHFQQGAAAWALALDESWSRLPLLCVLAKEESLSYNATWTCNTSCHPRGSGRSGGSACVLTSVLLSRAPALLEVQQLCETRGLMDSLFLLWTVKGGGTKILRQSLQLGTELRFSCPSSSSPLQSGDAISHV